MLHREAVLVTLVRLVDWIPMPEGRTQLKRGRPKAYPDRLIVKALVVMVIRRLYTAYSLLAFLNQDTELTNQLRDMLTENGRFPVRRTWERRLSALPDTLASGSWAQAMILISSWWFQLVVSKLIVRCTT